jgi:hypothetical protein
MHWNHRVLDLTEENDGEPLYAIKEVHYDENDKPTGYGEPSIVSEDLNELKWVVARLGEALTQPILKAKDFKESEDGRG